MCIMMNCVPMFALAHCPIPTSTFPPLPWSPLMLEDLPRQSTLIDAWEDARSSNDAMVAPIDEWSAAQDAYLEAPNIAVATTIQEGEKKEEPNFVCSAI